MREVICIGSACKDIFFPTKEGVVSETPNDVTAVRKISFELGAKYHIPKRHETLGGCSVNVAAGLAKIGVPVSCYSAVGGDSIAEWIRKEIAAFGAVVDDVYQVDGASSDLSAILVDENSGDRTIFSSHGASRMLKIEAEKLNRGKMVFVGDLSGDWKGNLEIIIETVKQNGDGIVFNPRQQMIHEDAKFVYKVIGMSETVILNKDEAIEIVMQNDGIAEVKNLEDEMFLLEKLFKSGVRKLAITDGIRGVWATDGKQIVHVDALKHDFTVDTTGAGDAFASGFVGALIKEKELAEAVRWGVVNSSNSVKFYGGQKGLLDSAEIDEMAKGLKVENL